MARCVRELQLAHERVAVILANLDEARQHRDGLIKEAIEAGVTWADAASAAGISTVQVGKIMKRPDALHGTGTAAAHHGRRAAS